MLLGVADIDVTSVWSLPLLACWLLESAGFTYGLPLQRRENLGLPPGDADPFFELSDGAVWQVRSLCPLA